MLPRWIVQMRTTHHSSTRQSKRVRPDWIKEYYRALAHENHNPRIRAGIHGATPLVKSTKSAQLEMVRNGPLALNEYRFWRAHAGGGLCRNCFSHVLNAKERMAHQKDRGCTRVLVDAYKLLLRDKKCTVCDQVTSLTKWGVPLCSTTCVYRWQFEAGAGSYPVHLACKLIEFQQQTKTL